MKINTASHFFPRSDRWQRSDENRESSTNTPLLPGRNLLYLAAQEVRFPPFGPMPTLINKEQRSNNNNGQIKGLGGFGESHSNE